MFERCSSDWGRFAKSQNEAGADEFTRRYGIVTCVMGSKRCSQTVPCPPPFLLGRIPRTTAPPMQSFLSGVLSSLNKSPSTSVPSNSQPGLCLVSTRVTSIGYGYEYDTLTHRYVHAELQVPTASTRSNDRKLPPLLFQSMCHAEGLVGPVNSCQYRRQHERKIEALCHNVQCERARFGCGWKYR